MYFVLTANNVHSLRLRDVCIKRTNVKCILSKILSVMGVFSMKFMKSVVSFKYNCCLIAIGCKSESTKPEIRQTDCRADTTAKDLFIWANQFQLVQLVFFRARVRMRKTNGSKMFRGSVMSNKIKIPTHGMRIRVKCPCMPALARVGENIVNNGN